MLCKRISKLYRRPRTVTETRGHVRYIIVLLAHTMGTDLHVLLFLHGLRTINTIQKQYALKEKEHHTFIKWLVFANHVAEWRIQGLVVCWLVRSYVQEGKSWVCASYGLLKLFKTHPRWFKLVSIKLISWSFLKKWMYLFILTT